MKYKYLGLGILIFVFLMLNLMIVSANNEVKCWEYINTNRTECETAFDGKCIWYEGSDPMCPEDIGCCAPLGCWDFNSSSLCEGSELGCIWREDDWGSWCEQLQCYSADFTNETYCLSLNDTYGMECEWEPEYQSCHPTMAYGSSCHDYDGNSMACIESGYCEWNPEQEVCNEPPMQFYNPSCDIFSREEDCVQVEGCSWEGSKCKGHDAGGFYCGNILTKEMCNVIPVLSTCCAWEEETCVEDFSGTCWDNMPPPPDGAYFCEDYNSFSNISICNLISGPPWFMPCKWDLEKEECHFKGEHFDNFEDINNQANCEAAGGIWRVEVYEENDVVKTDEWCEFDFGNKGNCDVSCWACEFQEDSTSWSNLEEAKDACEDSGVGFCAFWEDEHAINGYGWCESKPEFKHGANCEWNCGDCSFMNDPEYACENSPSECKWVTDSSDPEIGWCDKNNAVYCADDCFRCYDESSCIEDGQGGDGCAWNDVSHVCTPEGFSGEICFDGFDNDNNGFFDCGDPMCMFDPFCGGYVFDDSNCGFYSDETSCNDNNCVWIIEDFGGDAFERCGFPGEQCWMHDNNEEQCDLEEDCQYHTEEWGGFCDINFTYAENTCFSKNNKTGCNLKEDCIWIVDPYNPEFGRCEYKVFFDCEKNESMHESQEACEANPLCGWREDDFSHNGGFCGPKCFIYDEQECETDSKCEFFQGFCEPKFFGGGCPEFDGNEAECLLKDQTCVWNPHPGAPGPDFGFCDDKFNDYMSGNMDDQPPVMLGTDPDDGLDNTIDLMGFGLKNDIDVIGIGAMVKSLEDGALCNGMPIFFQHTGNGTLTTKFYYYLDTDGDQEEGCALYNDEESDGYDYFLSYSARWEDEEVVEILVAKQCVEDKWVAVPIPIHAPKDIMCGEVGGGIVAIDKEGLQAMGNYDASAVMRIYVATSGEDGNELSPADVVGPGYYTPGSLDYAFEDCFAKGQDLDGDGLVSENDPDCIDFFKHGYQPIEVGPQCVDEIDNDYDGMVDCDDDSCKHDPFFCLGSFEPDPDDITAPNVVWLEVEAFLDSAFIMFDTDEVSNGILEFYGESDGCEELEVTLYDIGMVDEFLSEYKSWHDVPIDNYEFNPQKLGYSLENGTTYFYKVKNCDPSDNCAVSRCLNFTTMAMDENCPSCEVTFDMDYEPPVGSKPTDPLGYIEFKVVLSTGEEFILDEYAILLNYSSTQNASLIMENPNSEKKWKVTLEGVKLNKLSLLAQGLVGDENLMYDEENDIPYFGFESEQFQILMQELRPNRIEICLPGEMDELWQCSDDLTVCVDKTEGALPLGYDEEMDQTCWEVPADWGS